MEERRGGEPLQFEAEHAVADHALTFTAAAGGELGGLVATFDWAATPLGPINDVLNFAKLEAGRVDYDIRDVSLAEAVADIAPMIEPQLAAKGITYVVRADPGLIARADAEKLRQIMLNLLSNAVKFTEGGGRVEIDTPSRDDQPDGFVFLRVTDTGIGIPRDRREAIFDPFVQAHRNLTRTTEGTGLGLAISRDLARAMGGDLRVRSEEGQGSSFTLALPAA